MLFDGAIRVFKGTITVHLLLFPKPWRPKLSGRESAPGWFKILQRRCCWNWATVFTFGQPDIEQEIAHGSKLVQNSWFPVITQISSVCHFKVTLITHGVEIIVFQMVGREGAGQKFRGFVPWYYAIELIGYLILQGRVWIKEGKILSAKSLF